MNGTALWIAPFCRKLFCTLHTESPIWCRKQIGKRETLYILLVAIRNFQEVESQFSWWWLFNQEVRRLYWIWSIIMSSEDYYDLNEDSKAEQLRHADLLRKYEAQKRGRSIALPTSIGHIYLTHLLFTATVCTHTKNQQNNLNNYYLYPLLSLVMQYFKFSFCHIFRGCKSKTSRA